MSNRRSSISTGAQRTRLRPPACRSRESNRTTFRIWVRPRSRRFSVASRTLGVVAMTAQRVEGIEESAQRIVDLMGHAGSKLAEHGIFLLVGEARSELLAFIQRARHRIEPIEQQIELAGNSLPLRLGNWVRASRSNALHVSAEYAQGFEHAPEGERAESREAEREPRVDSDQASATPACAREATRKCRFPRECARPKSLPREENERATPGRMRCR